MHVCGLTLVVTQYALPPKCGLIYPISLWTPIPNPTLNIVPTWYTLLPQIPTNLFIEKLTHIYALQALWNIA